VQLLSDWNGEATRGFGVEVEVLGMREVSRRTIFLVDEGGTVSAAWDYAASQVPDVDELLSAARAS